MELEGYYQPFVKEYGSKVPLRSSLVKKASKLVKNIKIDYNT